MCCILKEVFKTPIVDDNSGIEMICQSDSFLIPLLSFFIDVYKIFHISSYINWNDTKFKLEFSLHFHQSPLVNDVSTWSILGNLIFIGPIMVAPKLGIGKHYIF